MKSNKDGKSFIVMEEKGLCRLHTGSGKKGMVGSMWALRLGHRAVEGMDRESKADCGELKMRL